MIKTKDITILGSGISGLGSAKLAKKLGINVFVSDKNSIAERVKKYLNNNKISFKENGHDVERLFKSDEVIISPGISFSNLVIPSISVVKLFFVNPFFIWLSLKYAIKVIWASLICTKSGMVLVPFIFKICNTKQIKKLINALTINEYNNC